MSGYSHAPSRRATALRLALLATVLSVAAPIAVAARQAGPWELATLETGINSAQADGCPIESPNGLDLFIASTRPGAVGGASDPNDIWVAHRTAIDAAWGEP